MSLAHGYTDFLGWKKETTYGTAATPANKFIEIESESIKLDKKRIVKPMLGNLSQRRTYPGMTEVGGTIKFPLYWEGCEQLLEAAIGSAGTTGPVSTIYTHTFSLAAALPIGLTLQLNRDSVAIGGSTAFEYTGCQIDKMTLSLEPGGTLDCELDIVGRNRTQVALQAATFPTFDPIQHAQMTLAKLAPGGANFALPLRKWKLTVENNLFKDRRRLTDAGLRSGFGRAGQRKVMVEMELEFESATAFDYYKNLVAVDTSFTFVNGTKEFIVTTPTGYFQGEDPTPSDAGPIYVTMVYDSLANAADNDELSVVLKNTVSAV